MLNRDNKKKEMFAATSNIRIDQKDELGKSFIGSECAPQEIDQNSSFKQERDQNYEPKMTTVEVMVPKAPSKESTEKQSEGWQTIPKPKGHSTLDYARWDNVEDDSSEEEDDDDDEDEESLPQYRFRVKTVGVRPVK